MSATIAESLMPLVKTKTYATSHGYAALTKPYHPAEFHFLAKAIASLSKGKADFILINDKPSAPQTLSIWRKSKNMLVTQDDEE